MAFDSGTGRCNPRLTLATRLELLRHTEVELREAAFAAESWSPSASDERIVAESRRRLDERGF
jgi:hypothetical protein